MTLHLTVFVVLSIAQLPAKPDPQGPRVPANTSLEDVYREWAKTIRETSDAAKKMKGKTAVQRNAWLQKTAKAKEDKLRQRYKWTQYDLFVVLKIGLKQKWPTERPEDLAFVESAVAQRQENLDELVLNEEIDKWVEAHSPRAAVGSTTSLEGFQRQLQSSVTTTAELRKNVPFTLCPLVLPDGKKCGRKTVGSKGHRCYEHRSIIAEEE